MRPPLDLTLYLVTDTRLCGDLGVAATVDSAVAAGVTAVQLRDPDCTDNEFVRLGRNIRSSLHGSGVPLILNDRVYLVDEIGADGAHVGQHDVDVLTAREQIGPGAYLGLSVQTLEHVAAARRRPRVTVDYLGVGPVWGQSTKPDAGTPSGAETLASIVAASPWPCVAIGGIDPSRVAAVRRAGAAGVAVVSAICGQPDVTAATGALRRAWQEAA